MPRPAPRGMPEMPGITPWVPIVPTFPDLPPEIPWPPDFDWGDGLSPWYSGNDGRPYCYNDFASRLMSLIIAVSALRAAAGLRPMYPPFDLRFMVATPTIVNIATLWLATMWNTALIGGGTPDPSWTALYDWTMAKAASVEATTWADDISTVELSPLVGKTGQSAFEGYEGSAAVTFSIDVEGRMGGGVYFYAWRLVGTSYRHARIEIARGSSDTNYVRYQTAGISLTTVAITGDFHTIGYAISDDGTVTYTHNGVVLWSGAGKVLDRDLSRKVVKVYAGTSGPASIYIPLGTSVSVSADIWIRNKDRSYTPSAYENFKLFEEGAYNYGDIEVSQSEGTYAETMHYIDGDGNPVSSSSPTPPIYPLSLASLDCGQMNAWLSGVEAILWPILRA